MEGTDDRPQILLAEDDAVFAHLLAIVIERLGFGVVCAASVAAARAELAEGTFAAIVLDFQLPDGDARDLLDTLRAGPHRDTPIFVVSADREAPRLMSQLPVRKFFSKPVNTGAFKAELRSVADLPDGSRRGSA